MDLIDQLQALAARIPKQIAHLQTEEATKTALVMPLINALGYNVFDPTEVVPEFTADVATKKGEKVDYAIFIDGKPAILFECKWSGADLTKEHAAQLQRYFHVTEARFAVLTNGILYRFYTDLEQPNKMDVKPFYEFNLLDLKESAVEELKHFSKSKFQLESLLTAASELKYTKEIKRLMTEQMSSPSEDFVRFFAKQVYPNTLTANAKAQFTDIVQRSAQQLISDQISERLRVALGEEKPPALVAAQLQPEAQASPPDEIETVNQRSVTTEEEFEGYYIVKAILCSAVEPIRVKMRDVQSYCGILLDDNNRKPICRLYFNFSQKYLGLFDEAKNEERVPIGKTDDIYKFADQLRATAALYDVASKAPKTATAAA